MIDDPSNFDYENVTLFENFLLPPDVIEILDRTAKEVGIVGRDQAEIRGKAVELLIREARRANNEKQDD